MAREWASVPAARRRAEELFGEAWPAVLDARRKLEGVPVRILVGQRLKAAAKVEELLLEAEARVAEAARAGEADRRMGPAFASAADAIGLLRAKARTQLRLLRLATRDASYLDVDLRRAGTRGPLKTGRAAGKPPEEQRRGGMRQDLVRLARLEAAGRTAESDERGPVRLPRGRSAWALASIALGVDPPCSDAAEFHDLCQDRWRHVLRMVPP